MASELNVDEPPLSSTSHPSCANDPNFAVICAFLQKFATDLGLELPNFKQLQDWLSRTDEVAPSLRDMQIKLLRKTRKTVHEKSWETALSKFCFTYSAQDGWEIERFGYKNSSIKVKLRILRELLEGQFERNSKFRAKILTQTADSLRSEPIGRDRLGHAYWMTQDSDCNLRIYQEHLDEEIWQVVATSREEFVNLIERLRGNEVVLPSTDIGVIDEDTSSSNSCTLSGEKAAPPEEIEESQGDEQKVPKLSIKLSNASPNERDAKDLGKGEEELAADEDARLKRTTTNESCDDEFEEIEEEYEEESDSEDEDVIPDNDEDKKTVKPLLISQNKVRDSIPFSQSATRKRPLHSGDPISPTNREENQQCNPTKKVRPSLLDSKRSNRPSKYEENLEDAEEDYEESGGDGDDVEEEIEEEDIDSAAAEEDENEEKQIEDFDDEDIVGEEITDPVFRVHGEGSGKPCETGTIWSCVEHYFDDDEGSLPGDATEDIIFFVRGEGSGYDCLVGNPKNDVKSSPNSKINTCDKEEKSSLNVEEMKTTASNTCFDQSESLSVSPAKETSALDISPVNSENKPLQSSEDVKEVENKNKQSGEDNSFSNKVKEERSNGGNIPQQTVNLNIVAEESNVGPVEKEAETKEIPNKQETSEGNVDGKATTCKQETYESEPHQENVLKSEHCTPDRENVTKKFALESLKKELRESKQKSMERSETQTFDNSTPLSTPIALNRKRRLDDIAFQQSSISSKLLNSESEIDINSENPEDIVINETEFDVDEEDIGGKRLKMRQKQNNSVLRKKVEAQKAAANDETTSSSGGEEGSRRRRKIVSPKKHNERIVNETESVDKSSHDDSSTNNTNGQHKKCLPDKGKVNVVKGYTPVRQNASTSNSSTSAVKHKPTLAEIIEIKLKRTQEKEDKSCISTTDEILTKSVFPPPKKSPVTKPLKKNLLTQIRQESDEEAVPRKRTVSDDCENLDNNETRAILRNSADNQKVTPERQRKRHSSEEVAPNTIPEEPEAKKEVLSEQLNEYVCEFKSDHIVSTRDLPESQQLVDVKDKLKEDPDLDQPESICGRRSGRRGVPVVYTDISQAKRTRGCNKNTNKKDDTNIQLKPEVNRDMVHASQNKNNVKQEDGKRSSMDNMASLQVDSKIKTEGVTQEENEDKLLDNKGQLKQDSSTATKSISKGSRKQREVDTTNIIEATDTETPVRQSRRIAQQKIREEAERRKLEEIALRTMKQELKKKKKAEKQFDPTVVPPSEPSSESEESDMETKKKVQKRKCPGKNGSWSSGSEEQEEPDEEEDEEHHHYETDVGSPLFKSDHEFSPESDIEDETQLVPMKRARTARKENDPVDEKEEEEACQKCNKSDHPEWILLCDKCDKGYHCSCLSPVLFYIPEGDWYCPPCQQEQLIKALEEQLNEFDNMVERKRNEEKRLAEEEKIRQEEQKKQQDSRKNHKKGGEHNKNDSSDGASNTHSDENDDDIGNSDESEINVKKSAAKRRDSVFSKHKNKDKRHRYDRRKKATRSTRTRVQKGDSESDSDSQKQHDSESKSDVSSSSSSYSDSDNEPIYKLRKRRQINVSYRLNEYDDLINSALKKEMDDAAGAGNLGRGKDISTIIEADKEEKARQKQLEEDDIKTEEPAKTEFKKEQEKNTDTKNNDTGDDEIAKPIETDSDDEPIKRNSRPKPTLKKKPRKLTTLDISTEDDDGSDEDFKGSSIDDDDEDTSVSGSSNSDSSLEIYKRKDKSKKKQRKAARRAFRERRKDRRFVVEESDDDEDVQRPKSKKKRKDDSDYTESEVDDDDLSDLSENINSADLCDDTTTDESDKAWCPNKRKKSKKAIVVPTSHIASKSRPQQIKKSKKLEYSDDDISESEDDDDNDGDESSGVGGGKQPRSQPLIPTTNTSKTKAKAKGGSSSKIKKKKKSSEEELSLSDSGDSTRRTRGRRYAYIEDFDDDSSDGGIKPGVQRPDTPPEEREKFIKRQEEIKRMLAEKNAEGAKLAATPRLTPIKSESEKEKKSPSKAGDSLSTVPLSVIRQAKVLDIDYLQRRGENLEDLSNDVGEVDDDFDDADLPDDLPEDMDEDAIARMVEEEEDFGAVSVRELPPPDEVLRTPCTVTKPKNKDVERSPLPIQTTSCPTQPIQLSAAVTASGLQEPVRKRLPMPTMHPPLLRHQLLVHDALPAGHQMFQRHNAPLASHLLQNALSAPLTQSLSRTYPIPVSQNQHSLLNRMAQNLQMQPNVPTIVAPSRTPTPVTVKSTPPHLSLQSQDKSAILRSEPETKPRGRRKKITPLRDTLQKQQTAAAVAAASAASTNIVATAVHKASDPVGTLPPSAIKGGPPTSKGQIQTSVITSLPPKTQSISCRPTSAIPPSAIYPGSEGYYGSPGARIPSCNTQRHRGPPQMSPSLLTTHSALRPPYGPPPPLKGTITAPNILTTSGNVRTPLHLPPYVGGPTTARHSTSHLNLYGPSMYGNPNFGPRGNLRPSQIHSSEYPTGSRAYPPYGFYPPPPPLTTPPSQTPRVQTSLQRPPPSVIVSSAPSIPSPSTTISTSRATVNPPIASVANSPESTSKTVMIKQELPPKSSPSKTPLPPTTKANLEPRKNLTTLEAYTVRNTAAKSPIPLTTEISTSQTSPGLREEHVDDSSPPVPGETTSPSIDQQSGNEGHASEFSGLVSYFSSQHDDYNT